MIKISAGKTIQYTIGPDLEEYTDTIRSCLDWISERSCLVFVKVDCFALAFVFVFFRETLATTSSSHRLGTTTMMAAGAGPTLAGAQGE